MTDYSYTVDSSTELTTTTPVDITQQTTTGSSVTSSTQRGGTEFYFQCAVIVIGAVGMVANALILYAMVMSGEHKKHVLIFNQNALDFISCLSLIVTYSVKLCNIYLIGDHGYWLCMMILSEAMFWCPTCGSMVNIIVITIARYLRVIHPTWSKPKQRRWIIYTAAAAAWITGIVVSVGTTATTATLIDGACYTQVVYESEASRITYAIFTLSIFVTILVIFFFCYGRILIVVRRQSSVISGYIASGLNSSQVQSHELQSSVVKTMVLVCALHAVTWTPVSVYLLLVILDSKFTSLDSSYYVLLFISLLYFCINPFIYATKFDPVNRALLGLIPCKTMSIQPRPPAEIFNE